MNRLLVIIFVLLTSEIALAQNIPFKRESFPDRMTFKRAMKALEAGDAIYEQAVKDGFFGEASLKHALPHFEKAYEINPDNAELNYKMGHCYLFSREKFQALDFFIKSYELDPTVSPDIHLRLGQCRHLHGDWDAAIKDYEAYGETINEKKEPGSIEFINKKINECKSGKALQDKPRNVWIDNLGENVNSAASEYSPYISTDESLIVFTSRREGSTGDKVDDFYQEYYEDVWYSENIDGEWTKAKNIGDAVNTNLNDATAGISPDGKTIYVYYGYKNSGDIFDTKKKKGLWTKSKPLNKNINTKFHETSACVSSDGKHLYFVSDKPEDNLGDHDIFVSTWDEELQEWGPAKNLSPLINTKYDDRGAFIHPDGKTLYFSSKGHNTMGGFDIFTSTLDESGHWTEPQNIGAPINTPDDDVFFVVSASGRHGYYASYREDGYGEKDLYMITFLGSNKPPALSNEDNLLASLAHPIKEEVIEPEVEVNSSRMAILKGTVYDEETKETLGSIIELMDNEKHEQVAESSSDDATGKYLVSLPAGKNYGIAVQREGYLFHSENVIIPDTATFVEINKDIYLKKIEVGNVIILKNIFFDLDKYNLRPESKSELERLINLLNENPTINIEISGHTDSQGSAEYNVTLSQNRAKTVVTYLVDHGIEKGRLEFKGYGETTPIATNETAEGRQLNRRTEFKIVSK